MNRVPRTPGDPAISKIEVIKQKYKLSFLQCALIHVGKLRTSLGAKN